MHTVFRRSPSGEAPGAKPERARPPPRGTWGGTLRPGQLTKPAALELLKLTSGAGGKLVVVTAEEPPEIFPRQFRASRPDGHIYARVSGDPGPSTPPSCDVQSGRRRAADL